MKRFIQINLLLLGLLLTHQTLWAQEEEVFKETFAGCNGIGGADEVWDGSSVNGGPAVKNGELKPDNEGWTFTKCNGTFQCLKFGGASDPGTATTPHISLAIGSTATLTFKAAGWKETKNKTNKLSISATNCTVSGDIDITLEKATWKDYTVTISDIKGAIDIKFTGNNRGFLDEVVIIGEKGGEIQVTVPGPTLTDEFTFWANTTETAKRILTITPAEDTSVRYTTDGTEPTMEKGTLITTTTTLRIKKTTTIKAIAIKSLYTSDIVTKTYTLGDTKTSIADFTALTDDTEMRLFLSAEQMASVTSVNGKTFTLKDKSGSLVIDFGTVSYNPTPVVGQRVAGWIIGKKQTIGGAATMVATDKTNANYMIFAAPITDPSAIQTINKETKGDIIYHNLAGMRIKQPSKGVYIANRKKLSIH
jgi:hypothetical protein